MAESSKFRSKAGSRSPLLMELEETLLEAKKLEIRHILTQEHRLEARIVELEKSNQIQVGQVRSLREALHRCQSDYSALQQRYDDGMAALLQEHELELGRERRQREILASEIEKERAKCAQLESRMNEALEKLKKAEISEARARQQEGELRSERDRADKAKNELEQAMRHLMAAQERARVHQEEANRALRKLESANGRLAMFEECISRPDDESQANTGKLKYLERRLAESERKAKSLTAELELLRRSSDPLAQVEARAQAVGTEVP